MRMKISIFFFTFVIGIYCGLFSSQGIHCGSNIRMALFDKSKANLLKNKRVVTFEQQFACFQGDFNRDCIKIESDTIGEIIDYKPVYQIDEKSELETKNIVGYKLIVKWENIDSNYTSYLLKKSYFTEDGKEVDLNRILD